MVLSYRQNRHCMTKVIIAQTTIYRLVEFTESTGSDLTGVVVKRRLSTATTVSLSSMSNYGVRVRKMVWRPCKVCRKSNDTRKQYSASWS